MSLQSAAGVAVLPDVATILPGDQALDPVGGDPVARPTESLQSPTGDRIRLLAVLGRARRQAAAAMPASPDWEAAAAGVDAIELELDALDADAAPHDAASRSDGATTILDFGHVTLPDAVTIQGSVGGRADRAEAMLQKMRDLAGRADTRQGCMRELDRLATRNSFVVEVGSADRTLVTFYAWENRPPAVPL